MKKINLFIFIGILIMSCSSGGDDPDDPPKVNQAPSKVNTLTFPTNNLLCISNILEFSWASSIDPDGDRVSYLLEISKDNLFSTIHQSFTVSTTVKSVTLEKDVAYYWRVKAIDNKDLGSEYSETYQFYTEGLGETNHIPFAPELLAPEINATLSTSSTNLEWNTSDVDNDPLTFDVYFGTENPPSTKIGDNQSEKNLTVSLSPAVKYYWKVVAKDGKGGQSIGQIWSFSTN